MLCDVAVSRLLFARLARDAGHDVVEISSADEAAWLTTLREAVPAAIALDGRFGDPHGRRTDAAERCAARVARLRAEFSGVGIAVIAALGETALVAAAARAGADVVMPRPLLRTGVRAALDRLVALCAERSAP